MRVRAAVLPILLLCACGEREAATEEPPLLEVCEEAGSARLLPLGSNESVADVRRLDDTGRLAHVVEVFADPEAKPVARRVVVTGPCGEEPTTIATDVGTLGGDAELLIGCDSATRTLYRLDAAGADAPIVLASPVSCRLSLTDFGVVAVEAAATDAWGRLLLVSPEDASVEPLLDADVRVPPEGSGPVALQVTDDRVIALTLDSEVVVVSLADRSVDVKVSEASDLRVSSDGARILWQAGPVSPDVTVVEEGPVLVQPTDLNANEAVLLVDTHLGWSWAPFYDAYVAVRTRGGGGELIFTWPSLDPVALPPDAAFRGVSPDDAVWYGLGPDWRATQEWTVSPGSDPQLLYDGPGYPGRSDEGIEIFVPGEGGNLQVGELLLVPWSGGDPQSIAAPVHFGRVRGPGGTVLTVDARESNGVGQLWVHPAGGGAPFELDDRVDADSLALNRRRPFDEDVVYRVVDGDRAGLWRARLGSG